MNEKPERLVRREKKPERKRKEKEGHFKFVMHYGVPPTEEQILAEERFWGSVLRRIAGKK